MKLLRAGIVTRNSKHMNVPVKLVCISGLLLLSSTVTSAPIDVDNLYDMGFEQLMDIEVVSVSKKLQSMRQTAAAIHVISQVDIQRSGATTLPEVLRGAPGVHVAHVDGNKWAISIRGFNDRFANKLLVLVDGRSVYSPIFTGVYWNMQDIPLATIERVEIVRGAGGTLWGENAVNGVINIITKHSADTQGTSLSILAGSEDYIANVMYGGQLNEMLSYRVYSKAKKQNDYETSAANQLTANDGWENIQAGFRLDSEQDWFLEGSFMHGRSDATVVNYDLSIPTQLIEQDSNHYQAGHILFRTEHVLADSSTLQLQTYYDYAQREFLGSEYISHTFDFDSQHHFQWGDDNAIIWGLGYRGVQDYTETNNVARYSPYSRFYHTFTGFFQDEIQLASVVYLTLGSKVSHNEFSGFEYQPSARLLWQVNSQHSLWGAVSRAVRTPTRLDQDFHINVGVVQGNVLSINGNSEQKSEDVTSFELGYRGAVSDTLSFDATAFYNYYDSARSFDLTQGSFVSGNNIEVDSLGIELYSKWLVRENWQLAASYSYLQLDARLISGSIDVFSLVDSLEGADSTHQASLQSTWQLPYDLELNSAVYYVDRIKQFNVDNFTRVDLSLAWKPSELLELSVVGQNLLEPQHQEYASGAGGEFNSDVPRSVFAKITTQF